MLPWHDALWTSTGTVAELAWLWTERASHDREHEHEGVRYFGRQIGCLVARGCNSDGLAVFAAQNEAAAPGLLISGNR